MKLDTWMSLIFKMGLVIVIGIIIVVLNIHHQRIIFLEKDVVHLELFEDRFQEAYDGRLVL